MEKSTVCRHGARKGYAIEEMRVENSTAMVASALGYCTNRRSGTKGARHSHRSEPPPRPSAMAIRPNQSPNKKDI